jgi:hypothetical protein
MHVPAPSSIPLVASICMHACMRVLPYVSARAEGGASSGSRTHTAFWHASRREEKKKATNNKRGRDGGTRQPVWKTDAAIFVLLVLHASACLLLAVVGGPSMRVPENRKKAFKQDIMMRTTSI